MNIKGINRKMCQARIQGHFDKLKKFQKDINAGITGSLLISFIRGELSIYKLSYSTLDDYNFCVRIEEELDKIEEQIDNGDKL